MNRYLKKMLYALTSAYSRKDYDNLQSGKPVETNIGKLFSIFAWGLDMVQEQADLIKLWDDLDYAEGKVLDRYGANFGVKRGGASDPLYRLFIKVKMIAQLSSGDEDTIIKAAAEFLGVEYTELESEDVYPAKKWIYVDLKRIPEERLELIEQIAHAIKRTIAAGVGFRLYLRTYRSYTMLLPINHGGAIGENLFFQPAGQDRVDIRGFPVSHGAAIGEKLFFQPVGRDRADTEDLLISHGAELLSEGMKYEPIAEPRADKSAIDVSAGAILPTKLSSDVVLREHTFSESVSVAQGSVSRADLMGCMPDHKITAAERRRGVSGAICLSHIKSRRIE